MVLMWAFGNENNMSGNLGPMSPEQLFDFYQDVANPSEILLKPLNSIGVHEGAHHLTR